MQTKKNIIKYINFDTLTAICVCLFLLTCYHIELIDWELKYKELKKEFHNLCNNSYIADHKLNIAKFTKGLHSCPDLCLKGFVLKGLAIGFPIGINNVNRSFSHNIRNVTNNWQEKCAVINDLIKELKLGRVYCVTKQPNCVNPIRVIPKDENKFRLIRNLSFPEGASLNDAIVEEAKTVKFPTHAQIAQRICKEGRGCYIARQDLRDAYRQLKMRQSDTKFLGYKYLGRYLIDNYLVFGLSSACRTFQYMSLAVIFVFEALYLTIMLHLINKICAYLDDFIHIITICSSCDYAWQIFFISSSGISPIYAQ